MQTLGLEMLCDLVVAATFPVAKCLCFLPNAFPLKMISTLPAFTRKRNVGCMKVELTNRV